MPSKYSERLKQAIEYIRSGKKEIAREIILEIIQADPAYEKAWIWLVETVPDRENKIDILKTRLEQYPETSPYSRIALDKIAPEVLDTLVPVSEAIIYPEGMEPRSETTEDEIQYNVSVTSDTGDQFRLSEDELIQFEEPQDDLFTNDEQSPVEEINIFEEDDFFAEVIQPAASEEDLEFNLFEDIEGEEVQEQDLDFFLEEKPETTASPEIAGAVGFNDWLDEETQEKQQVDNVDELADLLHDYEPLDQNEEIVPETTDDFGVLGIQEEPVQPDTGISDPFIMDDASKDFLGEVVVDQTNLKSQSLDDFFVDPTPDNTGPSSDLFVEPDMSDSNALFESVPISQEDILAVSDSFHGDQIPPDNEDQKSHTPQTEKKRNKGKTKKQKKNAPFIFGCSLMAAALFIAVIALGFVILQMANDPQIKAITVTASTTPTVTSTVTAPAVAPWLQDDDEEVEATEQTPDPEEETKQTPEPEGFITTQHLSDSLKDKIKLVLTENFNGKLLATTMNEDGSLRN